MVCDMGQAIPDSEKENWYTNKPVQGLKLELRARAVIKSLGEYSPSGFVVVNKSGEDLIVFNPLGEYENGHWEGDVFNSWDGVDTEIEVFSERFGASGYAHFDLLSGNGFYYKTVHRNQPDYFLSNCRKIRKVGLPVYGWKYTYKDTKEADKK
jgi:hypothetical protein